MIVLDTNIVAALMADGAEIDPWLMAVPRHELYTTVMTRAEIRYGLARLPAGKRRTDLVNRADDLFRQTQERLLSFDAKAADRYGEVVAIREASGRPISVADAIIASIAWVHHASLATRNVRDFDNCEIAVVNPYDS
ncbi:MAG TPA: type II toxin-antitoxin system VapC family toxin [Propionibacteriaceae bacterium]|jgi:predicted nucleic acid-binding protein